MELFAESVESSVESKEALRLRMKEARGSMAKDDVANRSLKVSDRLLSSSLLHGLSSIALYAAIRNEVSTQFLFDQLKARNIMTCFPRILSDGIEFVSVSDWHFLRPGSWNIPEPFEGELIPLEALEAVLVPGLAFDEAGRRLGWGGGYFDRTLEAFEGKIIGLAYDFQVVSAVPCLKTDVMCHWIVTETRVIRGASA